jgi:hypothetical protein
LGRRTASIPHIFKNSLSPIAILRAAACEPDTPAIPRDRQHHALVEIGARAIAKEENSAGGQLGRPTSARDRTYERLKHHLQEIKGTLFETRDLHQAFDIDRVTKKIYEQFKKEHAEFLKFIQSIQVTSDREWYASVMLNRLMFKDKQNSVIK